MAYCFKCGAPINDGQVFCMNCGIRQPAAVNGSATQAATGYAGGAYSEPTRGIAADYDRWSVFDQAAGMAQAQTEGQTASGSKAPSAWRVIDFAAIGLSIVASVIAVMSFPKDNYDYFIIAGIIAFISYLLGGGFMRILGAAKHFAIIGWVAVPFPLSLVAGLMTGLGAAMFLFAFPVIFVVPSVKRRVRGREAIIMSQGF